MSTGLLLKLLSGQARRIDGCSCKNKWSMACAHCSHSAAALATMAAVPGDHLGSIQRNRPPTHKAGLNWKHQKANTNEEEREEGKFNFLFPFDIFLLCPKEGS